MVMVPEEIRVGNTRRGVVGLSCFSMVRVDSNRRLQITGIPPVLPPSSLHLPACLHFFPPRRLSAIRVDLPSSGKLSRGPVHRKFMHLATCAHPCGIKKSINPEHSSMS